MSRRSPELAESYVVREVQSADLKRGLLNTLDNLSPTKGVGVAAARRALSAILSSPLHKVFVVVTGEGEVVGTTTLLLEPKLIHGGGLAGHIEDVAVRKGYEGKGVGSAVVGKAISRARELGCYKVILDCKEELVPFYTRLGMRRHEVGMRIDLK